MDAAFSEKAQKMRGNVDVIAEIHIHDIIDIAIETPYVFSVRLAR